MKRIIFVLSVLPCITSNTVFADTDWNVESGDWANALNWTNGVPDGTNGYINLRKSSTSVCTLNTDEGLLAQRWIMQNGQTMNIENGGSFGAQWSRVGRGSASYINMTGNGTYVMNDDDLYAGLEGGSCEWKMYETSSLMTQGDDGDDSEELHIGYNNGYGLLQLNGSDITVNVDRIHFSNRNDLGDPSSTLEFVVDADGVSTIVSQIMYIAEAGTAELLLTDPGVTLADQDIVLIQATSANGIGGSGAFDLLNGGPASEGTYITLGGNVYSLTYAYDADGDSNNNDVALVYESDVTVLYKAHSPVPGDGTDVIDSPTTLSWTNPEPQDGISSITCTVYFGTSSNRTNMNSVILSSNVSTVEINTANFPTYGTQPLLDETDYYWIVDCIDASPGVDPTFGQGNPWTFHTYLSLPEYDGFGGQSTGGEAGSAVTVYNASDLKYWAYTSTVPCIITIGNSFTMSGGNGTNGGACPIRSNKTIQGANPGVVFTGNFETSASNVIIRNLTITNPDDPANPDGASIGGSDCITIYGASNVYITHCTLVDAADGLLDIRDGADNITISWCKFYYTWNNGHNLASLGAGASDTDSGLYRITWHHNWWSDLVNQRMPMIRFGNPHMYNNYFNAPGNYYCTNVRISAGLLSEHNYYYQVNNPLYIEPGSSGKASILDNVYDTCTGLIDDGNDTVFVPPYYYVLDPVEEVPAIVTATAGNRLYGDLNDDGTVDTDDLAVFSELWLNGDSRVAFHQDLDDDGLVSLYEFMHFAANWLLNY